jgi:hypothetical protein
MLWVLTINYLNLCLNLLIGFSKNLNENQQKPRSKASLRKKKRIFISTFEVGMLATKVECSVKELKARFQTQGIMLLKR